MNDWWQQLSRQQYALIRKEAPLLGKVNVIWWNVWNTDASAWDLTEVKAPMHANPVPAIGPVLAEENNYGTTGQPAFVNYKNTAASFLFLSRHHHPSQRNDSNNHNQLLSNLYSLPPPIYFTMIWLCYAPLRTPPRIVRGLLTDRRGQAPAPWSGVVHVSCPKQNDSTVHHRSTSTTTLRYY